MLKKQAFKRIVLWSLGPILLLGGVVAYCSRPLSMEQVAVKFGHALSTGKTGGIENYIAPWEMELNDMSPAQARVVIRDGLHPMMDGYTYRSSYHVYNNKKQLKSKLVFEKDGKEWPVDIIVDIYKDKPRIFLGITANSIWMSKYMIRDGHGQSEINYRRAMILGLRKDAALLTSLGLKGSVTNDIELQTKVAPWNRQEARLLRELEAYGAELKE